MLMLPPVPVEAYGTYSNCKNLNLKVSYCSAIAAKYGKVYASAGFIYLLNIAPHRPEVPPDPFRSVIYSL